MAESAALKFMENAPDWRAYEENVNAWIEKAAKTALVRRIWQKDAGLWKKDPGDQRDIKARLGWLDCVFKTKTQMNDILSFAEEARKEFNHVVLLGMGGSSLAPEVFQSLFGNKEGYPALLVLDSTDPARVKEIESKVDLEKTLFIVSSKSGGTVELLSFFKYFYERVKEKKPEAAGRQFAAITDPNSPLADLAKKHRFRKTFFSPEDVGGRFSALTPFGLVPAALIGVEVARVIEAAERMMQRCGPDKLTHDNPALVLGVGMAVLAEEGRDKLTIVSSQKYDAFGDWVEQLVAESTGKEGMGVIPVLHEKLGGTDAYGDDRFFVAAGADDNQRGRLDTLREAGHPLLQIDWRDPVEIGAEFFRWEMATAIACALMKINAFDQPDVQAAKERAKALLKKTEAGAELPLRTEEITLAAFWENAEKGDYVALLAFLPASDAQKKRLGDLANALRDKTKLAVTVGFGPRYLHSTGQLHKGGPGKGVFLLLTAPPKDDLPVPGEKYSFGKLELAQAIGDFEALESKARWAIHLRLPDAGDGALDAAAKRILDAARAEAEFERELKQAE